MDAELRARKASAHIVNQNVRNRVYNDLLVMFRDLDNIVDTDEETCCESSHIDDVPVVSAAVVDQAERSKLAQIEKMAQFTRYGQVRSVIQPEVIVPAINRRARYGYTPLMEAVIAEDIKAVQQCLDAGANKYITDSGGNTPLEKALTLGLYEIAALLK